MFKKVAKTQNIARCIIYICIYSHKDYFIACESQPWAKHASWRKCT